MPEQCANTPWRDEKHRRLSVWTSYLKTPLRSNVPSAPIPILLPLSFSLEKGRDFVLSVKVVKKLRVKPIILLILKRESSIGKNIRKRKRPTRSTVIESRKKSIMKRVGNIIALIKKQYAHTSNSIIKNIRSIDANGGNATEQNMRSIYVSRRQHIVLLTEKKYRNKVEHIGRPSKARE